MVVGVPENEVFAAADTVLARGERPTVERVRLELGRGSPARVGGLLDQWWARLAERLSGETRLPTLPAQVSQAFVAVWQQATQLAQGIAEQGLSEQRQVLATERDRLAEAEDQGRQAAAQDRQQVADALAGRQAAETRLADLELLLDQRLAQIADLRQQREELLRERVAEQQQAQLALQQLRELTLKADQERSVHETYLHGAEDRAHREVDRAREESRATTAQFKQLGKHSEALEQRLAAALVQISEVERQAASHQFAAQQSAQQVQDMHGQLLTLQGSLNEALQHGAAQGARAETLEQHIRQLQGLLKPEPKKGTRKPVPAQRNVRSE